MEKKLFLMTRANLWNGTWYVGTIWSGLPNYIGIFKYFILNLIGDF